MKLKGIEYLNFLADIYKVSKKDREEIIETLSKKFGIYDNLNDIKLVFKNFLKWFVLSLISGISVGIVIALFLKSLQYIIHIIGF